MLKLHKPLCFFDLETTGINVAKDRIVEISILKVFPNGNKESKTIRVNPEIPISAEATSVHGISNEDVANEPTFGEIAPQIWEMMKDSDLAGYNSNRFDIPLLVEEFIRNNIEFDLKNHRFVDRSEERRVGKECRSRQWRSHCGRKGRESRKIST